MSLTEKQQRFVEEYLVDLNATRAAIRTGYAPGSAEVQGSRLLSNAKVAAEVARLQAERANRTEITADRVLQELWAIATADPNELIQFRRGACRKCWSEDADPDEEDYDRAKEPNPDCLTCSGEGVGHAHIADTRKLNGAARKLYAGVKVTKEGIEVKMHDKAAALVNVGKHLGMFVDKVEHTGGVTLVMQSLDDKL